MRADVEKVHDREGFRTGPNTRALETDHHGAGHVLIITNDNLAPKKR